MFRSIAVIGGGQLGSRHLQALAQVGLPLSLYVVDPSAESRALAEERYRAVAGADGHALTLLSSIDGLPKSLELVIVATTANVRLVVIKNVLAHAAVANWLLEKVLFQNLDEYAEVAGLFGPDASVWVNCAQRLWPFFIELKEKYGRDAALEVQVVGSNWGLGCNAVHNTDIAQFLWDGPLTHVAQLDPVVLDSKRSGFREFTGLLETRAASGGRIRQISYADGSAPFSFIVHHPEVQMIWQVGAGRLIEASTQTDWQWNERVMQAPYQSVLTKQVAEAILHGRPCGLPSFANAAPVHIGTLEALIDGARRQGHDFGRTCPVT